MAFNISKKYNDADPRKLADWQLADIAEENMPTVDEWRDKLGLKKDEIIPYGKLCAHAGGQVYFLDIPFVFLSRMILLMELKCIPR